MAATTWQTELYAEVFVRACFYKQNENISLEEAIKKTAQMFILQREQTLETSSFVKHASKRPLNPQQALEVDLTAQKLLKREEAAVEDEDGFLLVDVLEPKNRRELKLLKAWEKNPASFLQFQNP